MHRAAQPKDYVRKSPGSYYHLNHHYDKVMVQQADPRFASDIKVDD